MGLIVADPAAPGPFVPPAEVGGGGGTNEPSGMTANSRNRDFSEKNPTGWTDEAQNGGEWNLISDANEPISSPSAGEIVYPSSGGGGSWFGRSYAANLTGGTTVYWRFSIKLSDPFQGHDSGVNKIGLISGENLGPGSPCVPTAYGIDSGTIEFQMRLQNSNHGARNIEPNLTTGEIVRGSWHDVEVVMVANTPGTNDGELHVWIDGTKSHEYTDVGYFASGDGPGFDSAKWEPIWGGTGDTLAQEQSMALGHWYMSEK